MKVYLLRRIGSTAYDEVGACVVVARNPADARGFAADEHMDEPANTWTNPELSTCAEVGTEPGVICQHIRYGCREEEKGGEK